MSNGNDVSMNSMLLNSDIELFPLVFEFWRLGIKTFYGFQPGKEPKEFSGSDKGYILFEKNSKSKEIFEYFLKSPNFKKKIFYSLSFDLDGIAHTFVDGVEIDKLDKVFGRKSYDRAGLILEDINNPWHVDQEMVDVYCFRFTEESYGKIIEGLKKLE